MPSARRTVTLLLVFVVCVLVVASVVATPGVAVGKSPAATAVQDFSAGEASLALNRADSRTAPPRRWTACEVRRAPRRAQQPIGEGARRRPSTSGAATSVNRSSVCDAEHQAVGGPTRRTRAGRGSVPAATSRAPWPPTMATTAWGCAPRAMWIPSKCTDRDAPFALDGVLYHESDLDCRRAVLGGS